MKKMLLTLCLVLALVCSLAACATSDGKETTEATVATEADGTPVDGSTLGEGAHSFAFQVVMTDGKTYNYTVNTDEEVLGKALLSLGLVEGEDTEYGLFVNTVLGVTLDYTADGYYWSLTENGEYASVGADSVTITDGTTYAFVATAAE